MLHNTYYFRLEVIGATIALYVKQLLNIPNIVYNLEDK